MRRLGFILIALGTVVFLGNLTRIFPTIPGIGVATAVIGYILLRVSDKDDAWVSGSDHW